jgi:uncharacterized membrane protein YfcA
MVDSFAPETIAFAVGIAIVAGVVRGITGFGGAMVMTPLLALLVGPQVAVPVVLLLEGVAATPMVWQTRALASWRVIAPMIGAVCITAPLGVYLLLTVDPQVLRRVIAAIVVVFSLLLLRGWRYSGAQRTATAVGVGGLSGVLVGSTSMAGPPMILYLLAGPDRVETTRANLTYCIAGASLVGVAVLSWGGLVDLSTGTAALALTPGYWGGMAAGSRLFTRFNDQRFRRFTLVLLIALSTIIVLV